MSLLRSAFAWVNLKLIVVLWKRHRFEFIDFGSDIELNLYTLDTTSDVYNVGSDTHRCHWFFWKRLPQVSLVHLEATSRSVPHSTTPTPSSTPGFI